MNDPLRPAAGIRLGTPSHRLLRGVMRMDLATPHVERVVLYRAAGWTVSLVDTGDGDATAWSPEGDTTLHILWQANEDDAWVVANGDHFPIAPGDTMSVPASAEIRLAAGMLLVRIGAGRRSLTHIIPPSHGRESFEGYNRRTHYETPEDFSLQRWKITQPLTIPPLDALYAVIDLAEPLALAWPGGTDLIGRGECRVIPPDTGPVTLLPNGLGYALVIR